MSWLLVLLIVVVLIVAATGVAATPSWLRYRRIRRM